MATVPRQHITQRKIAEHVQRLGELYPPIPLDSVDRTIKRPWLVARKFGHVIDYLARVELEVDRNVLELLVLLPDADDTNKTFYADVWQPQEIQHGLILDRLQQDLGRTAAEPELELSFGIKILGALAHLKPIQEIAKLMYFLTGASTERQAVLAYNKMVPSTGPTQGVHPAANATPIKNDPTYPTGRFLNWKRCSIFRKLIFKIPNK